jgi:hypothetical protein
MHDEPETPPPESQAPSSAVRARETAAESGLEDWDIIHRYTRKEAIAHGDLRDVSETAREVGIRFPVALTRAVWNEYVALTPAAERARNDESGRLWDIVWMLRLGISRNRSESSFLFELYVVTESVRPSLVQLRAVVDGGDDGEPVITVLLPDED